MINKQLWSVDGFIGRLGQRFSVGRPCLRGEDSYDLGPGGTQLWVRYGCAARSFDHHPITKPEKTQICNL